MRRSQSLRTHKSSRRILHTTTEQMCTNYHYNPFPLFNYNTFATRLPHREFSTSKKKKKICRIFPVGQLGRWLPVVDSCQSGEGTCGLFASCDSIFCCKGSIFFKNSRRHPASTHLRRLRERTKQTNKKRARENPNIYWFKFENRTLKFLLSHF